MFMFIAALFKMAKIWKQSKAQTSSYKISKSWNVLYNMVTIVNNTVLCIIMCSDGC